MKETTKSYISFVTLLIVFIIFVQINVLTIMIFELKGCTSIQKMETQQIDEQTIAQIKEWKLNIPKINIVGNIVEGTKEDIINDDIGHFSNTPYINGNIGLIAGCYGYKENYFSKLEQLQKGDVIIYQYKDNKKQYKVKENIIIDEKDWSHLSNTKENKLTLITGVVNEPQKRRCVKAEEII